MKVTLKGLFLRSIGFFMKRNRDTRDPKNFTFQLTFILIFKCCHQNNFQTAKFFELKQIANNKKKTTISVTIY